jgi:hypothetical protein
MTQKKIGRRVTFIILTILFFSSGCTTALRNKQLEKVAKDWALVIRASQVIPVYPLTEDLQPGDVLLVRTPINEQVKLYKKSGFLPLDQHLIRLYPEGYYAFYKARYGITDENIIPPAHWQKVDGNKHNWNIAPHAAFPTYQFEVRTGAGLNLAIPIEGVPFALGLMNSGRASGTVTIADAYTFGLDNFHIENLVRGWGLQNRDLLRKYEPKDEKGNERYHFLRVISRVYVTGRVVATLSNDQATGAEVAAGADRPVNLMGIKENATLENYNAAIGAINNLLKEQLPGGKVKIATASRRSVTLDQSFDRPLIIGYVGFDMPILKGGRLGIAISTLSQLSGTRTLSVKQVDGAYVYRLASISHINTALKQLVRANNEGAKNIFGNLNKLSRLLPDRYPFTAYHQPSPVSIEPIQGIEAGYPIDKQRGFEVVLDYLGYADTSRESLNKYLSTAAQATDDQKKIVNEYKQELQRVQSAIKELEDRLNGESALMEAIDFIFFGK